MTTLYAVYDNLGLMGRCDGRCHEAKRPECYCICGGALHGAGAKITQKEIGSVSNHELIKNAIKRGVTGPPRVFRAERQLEMFAGKGS